MGKRSMLAALAPVVLLAGCDGGADPATVLEAVRATEQSQLEAIAARDLVGIARLYADDAQLVRPDGSRIEGAVAITEEFGDLLEDANFALAITPQAGWAAASGDLAVLTSRVSFTTTDPATGEPVTQPLESIAVWTRATGSTWKIISAYNVGQGPAPASAADAP